MTKEEEGGSKGDAVKKGEEVERVELWGRAHEGKALLCSYSVLGRLGDVTTTLDFPGGQAPSDAEIYGQIEVSGRMIGGRPGVTERADDLVLYRGSRRMRRMTGHGHGHGRPSSRPRPETGKQWAECEDQGGAK